MEKKYCNVLDHALDLRVAETKSSCIKFSINGRIVRLRYRSEKYVAIGVSDAVDLFSECRTND